jgi:hypothetical protein
MSKSLFTGFTAKPSVAEYLARVEEHALTPKDNARRNVERAVNALLKCGCEIPSAEEAARLTIAFMGRAMGELDPMSLEIYVLASQGLNTLTQLALAKERM